MIRAGLSGPVKIGRAWNPEKRLLAIQGTHYEELRFMRLFHGGKGEEASLHRKFSALRIRGEWFHFTDDMLGDVGLLEAAPGTLWTDQDRQSTPQGFDKSLYRQAGRIWRGLSAEQRARTDVSSLYASIVAAEGMPNG